MPLRDRNQAGVEPQRVRDDERGHRRAARRRGRETRRAGGCGGSRDTAAAPRFHERFHLVAEARAAEPLGVTRGWRRRRSGGRAARPIASANALGDRLVDQQCRSRRARRSRSAPPRPSATTGRPHACASSGTMPKSSSPGSSDDRRPAVQVANVVVATRGRGTARSPPARALERGALRAVADDVQRHAGEAARVDGDVDALVGDEGRHDEREPLGCRRVRDGRTRCRRADTPQSPRDYSIGGSCPQHSER